MKIDKKKNGTELIVEVIGRLDSLTSPELEDELEESYEGITKLILDLGQLEYLQCGPSCAARGSTGYGGAGGRTDRS